jgi:2-aminomuconate deaminase
MTEHYSDKAPTPVGPYPHARKAGDFLFLSGVGPRVPGSNEIPGNRYNSGGKLIDYDIELQCHSVFANIKNILESAGARWEDLVDITIFLTDMETDFEVLNRIYGEYFIDHQPCRTTVEVRALPTQIAIELKCVAYISQV